eukprot:8926591-Pyramimonas_sp.AAC.1
MQVASFAIVLRYKARVFYREKARTDNIGHFSSQRVGQPWLRTHPMRWGVDIVDNIASFYGSSCANNGKGCAQHPIPPLPLFSPCVQFPTLSRFSPLWPC